MAYFTKKEYERKAEYAYRVSMDSLNILSEATGFCEDELACVERASHARHDIHSLNRWRLISCCGVDFEALQDVGLSAAWYEPSIDSPNLATQIDSLRLLPEHFPRIECVEVDDDDSTEDIYDYFGEELPADADEFDLRQSALEMLYYAWDEAIDKWSVSVRAWFRDLNNKYGTKFPD